MRLEPLVENILTSCDAIGVILGEDYQEIMGDFFNFLASIQNTEKSLDIHSNYDFEVSRFFFKNQPWFGIKKEEDLSKMINYVFDELLNYPTIAHVTTSDFLNISLFEFLEKYGKFISKEKIISLYQKRESYRLATHYLACEYADGLVPQHCIDGVFEYIIRTGYAEDVNLSKSDIDNYFNYFKNGKLISKLYQLLIEDKKIHDAIAEELIKYKRAGNKNSVKFKVEFGEKLLTILFQDPLALDDILEMDEDKIKHGKYVFLKRDDYVYDCYCISSLVSLFKSSDKNPVNKNTVIEAHVINSMELLSLPQKSEKLTLLQNEIDAIFKNEASSDKESFIKLLNMAYSHSNDKTIKQNLSLIESNLEQRLKIIQKYLDYINQGNKFYYFGYTNMGKSIIPHNSPSFVFHNHEGDSFKKLQQMHPNKLNNKQTEDKMLLSLIKEMLLQNPREFDNSNEELILINNKINFIKKLIHTDE